MGKKVFLLTTILIISFISGYGKNNGALSESNQLWINVGGGLGGVGKEYESRLALCFSTTYKFRNHGITFRVASSGKSNFEVGSDFGLLYTRAWIHGSRLLAVGAGIGYLQTTLGRDKTIGLPLEIQFFLRARRLFGIGVYGFTNINPKKLIAGICLCLQIHFKT